MLVVNIAGRLNERPCSCINCSFSHIIAFLSPIEGAINSVMKARTCSSFQTSKTSIILLIKVGSRTRTATLLSFLKTEIWYDSLKILLLLLILPIWLFHPVTSVHFTSVLCTSFSSVVHSFLFCFAVFKNICHVQFFVCFFPLVCATSWTLSSLTVWSSLHCSRFSGQVTLQNQRKGEILALEGRRGSHFLWSHSKRCPSQWVFTWVSASGCLLHLDLRRKEQIKEGKLGWNRPHSNRVCIRATISKPTIKCVDCILCLLCCLTF